jgi:hypothetical protein
MGKRLTLRDNFCGTFCLLKRLVGLRAVLFGGNANESANAGFSYSNSNNTPSNSNTNYSSHLSDSQNNVVETDDPGSCQNMTIQKRTGSENERSRSEKQIIKR